MSQEISIQYGSVTVGGSSGDYTIDGPFRYEQNYTTGTISADVIVANLSQYTATTFAAACDALEDAYRLPRQALLVKISTTTLLTLSHVANTALNTEPSIVKVGGDEDTGRSRKYRISVSFGLPADLSGQSGRQSSTVEVAYDASRIRTVTISGVYTALASNAARAQYDSASATYFAAIKSALSITNWEMVGPEVVAADDADKYVQFRAVFREIVYAQSSAGMDHANVVGHTVTFSRDVTAPGDSGGGKTKRRQTVVCAYDCSVRDTQDLAGLWEDTLRSYVLGQFNTRFPNGGYGVTDEQVSYDQTNQRISARLTISMVPAGATALESVQTVRFETDKGLQYTGAWDGDADSFYIDQGKRVKIAIITLQEMHVGLLPPSDNLEDLNVPFFSGTGWRTIKSIDASTPMWIGQPGGPQFAATLVDRTVVKRFAKKPKAGGGPVTTPTGGGGGATTGGGGRTTTPSAGPSTEPGGAVPPNLGGGGGGGSLGGPVGTGAPPGYTGPPMPPGYWL